MPQKDVKFLYEEKVRPETELVNKLHELAERNAWFQIAIRGVKGAIKEFAVTETKQYSDNHQ